MHTSAFTLQALVQNLATSDPSRGYMETLRHEAKDVLGEANGQWTREAVPKPFSIFGLPRTVIDPNGLSVNSHGCGYFIPTGSIVALPVEHAHYDEKLYQDARSFQPFRFVHSEGTSTTKSFSTASRLKKHLSLRLVTENTGAQDGFFVTHEIKLMMANILLNYEIEPLKSPKQSSDVMWLKLPLNGLTLNFRRRTSCEEN